MSQKSEPIKTVGLIIAVFAIVGVGLGLTGYLSLSWMQGTFTSSGQGEFANAIGQMFVAVIMLQSVILTFFTGPTVATITGLVGGAVTSSRKRAAAINGAGTFVGFYVMVVIAVFVMTQAYSSGGSSGSSESTFQMGRALGTALQAGIPTAAVGVVAGYLGASFDSLDVSIGREQPAGSAHSDD